MSSLAVILPAAGRSTRFGGSDKLRTLMAGKTVLARTVAAFVDRPDVAAVILVSREGGPTYTHPKLRVVAGGASRAESVRNGLLAVDASVEWVAVHDAARPLASRDLIDRTFAAARQHGAAAPALPVTATVKQATGPLPAVVERTVPRDGLWAMQTPQVMRRAELVEAYERCPVPLETVTDDVQLLELAGRPVWLVPGDEANLKVTTQLDLRVAELIAQGALKTR